MADTLCCIRYNYYVINIFEVKRRIQEVFEAMTKNNSQSFSDQGAHSSAIHTQASENGNKNSGKKVSMLKRMFLYVKEFFEKMDSVYLTEYGYVPFDF